MPARRLHIWWLFIPALTAGNQIFAKILAGRLVGEAFGIGWLARAIPTPWFAGIVLCQLASLFLWLKILSTVSISKALPLTASSYILIVLLSVWLFGEKLQAAEIGGSVLILIGVWLIASGASSHDRK